MAGTPWSADERDMALDVRPDGRWRHSARAVAKAYPRRTPKAVHKYRENESRRVRLHRAITQTQYAPELFHVDLGEAWRLEGDWVIVGDVHAPTTDYEMAIRVSHIARRMGIKRLLIAGDLLNLDFLSTYDQIIELPDWKAEKAAAHHLLAMWLDTFDEIRWTRGNHETRLNRFFNAIFGIDELQDLIGSVDDRIRVNHWGWCEIDTPQGVWRVTHPKNYSILQLNVADTLAQKFDCHVISFHEHHLAMGWDRFKRHMVVNGGGLMEPSKLAYATLDDSKSSGMAKGFVVLTDGCPLLFGEEPLTDWSKWLE